MDAVTSTKCVPNGPREGAVFFVGHQSLLRATSVPIRREAWIDEAFVLWKRGDCRAIVMVELDMQGFKVGLLTFRPRCLRNRRDAILIEQPFQRDLRRG